MRPRDLRPGRKSGRSGTGVNLGSAAVRRSTWPSRMTSCRSASATTDCPDSSPATSSSHPPIRASLMVPSHARLLDHWSMAGWAGPSHREVPRLGMPGHEGAGAVFGVHLVAVAEVDADLGAMEQVEDGAVAFEVGAGRVAVGVARSLVALGEEGAARQVLGVDAQLPADAGGAPL